MGITWALSPDQPKDGSGIDVDGVLGDGRVVRVRLAEVDRGLVPVWIGISPRSRIPFGLDGAFLRSISIPQAIKTAVMSKGTRVEVDDYLGVFRPEDLQRLRTGRIKRKRGSTAPLEDRTLSDELLVAVAVLYLAEYQGGSKAPATAIAKRLQQEGLKEATPRLIRSWVFTARQEGWLTPTSKGKKGGDATEQLVSWIEDHPGPVRLCG